DNDPGLTTGFTAGVVEGFTPGVVPGQTPGVNPGETPGINPGNPDNIIVGDPGFTPGVKENFTPGIDNDPGLTTGFTAGVVEGFTPGVVPNFTPGVDPFYDPSTGQHRITEENKMDPIRSGTSETVSTDHTIASSASVQKYTVSSEGTEHVTSQGSLASAQPVEVRGSLVNDGVVTTSALNVQNGGTLEDHGVLHGDLHNQGTVATDTAQTATVDGNLTQSPTGKLHVKMASGSSHSALQVNGDVHLDGQVEIASEEKVTPGSTQKIISSTGSIKGHPSAQLLDQPQMRVRLVIIGDPELVAVFAPTSYVQYAQSANQKNVAQALNSFIPAQSGDELLVSTDLDFLTATQYPAAFNAIMPTLYQSLSTIAFNIENAQNQEMIQRLWGLRLAGASGFSMNGFADTTAILDEGKDSSVDHGKDILRLAPDNHWGMFVDSNGIFAQANSANSLPTYNAQSGGVTTGLSYQWNKQLVAGIYTGYQGVYSKYNVGSTLIDDSVNFGLFGTYGEPDGKGFFVDGLVGGAYNNYTMRRNIAFGVGDNAINRTATGTPGAGELDSMVATGYDIQCGHLVFGPLSSLQYQYFGANSFNESGAQSLDLNAAGWNTSSMIYSLGGHASYQLQVTKKLLLIPQLSLSWQHEFLQNPYSINSTLGYGTSSSFATWSSTPLRDTLYTGVGFTAAISKNWDTSFFYNAAAGNPNMVSQNIFWGVGIKF
ncbi:MAG: autotransporter outer membrane beta-barrel domain-containing protein, partial [Chthoniobacterales bacterium]